MADAVLAVHAGPRADGFAWRCGETFMSGEFEDRYQFLCAIEALLQNGFEWTVLTGQDAPKLDSTIWFLCVRHGANFLQNDPGDAVTDPMLRNGGMWRRGLIAANNAARIIYFDERTTT